MAKKVDSYIKLQVKAGQANPSPPVGPALGQPVLVENAGQGKGANDCFRIAIQ